MNPTCKTTQKVAAVCMTFEVSMVVKIHTAIFWVKGWIIRPKYTNAKGNISYNCISGSRSGPLQAKIRIDRKRYRMPEMYNLEVCKALKILNIKT
jgi:hypothetical protein